jgi:hypothetical protein
LRKKSGFIAIILSVALLAISISSVSNVSADNPNNAFTVDKAIFDMNVNPGANLPQTVTLSSDPTADPLDVNVEVDGLGQTNQGANVELDAQSDTPFSARTYITNITPATFQIAPGTSEKISFNINVPSSSTPGEKYAVIRIYSNPYGIGQGAAAVVAVDIPIILDVDGITSTPTGQIASLAVTSAVVGAPLEIQSTLLNTGTGRIPAETTINRLVIKDSSGNTVVQQTDIPVNDPSILPGFDRTIIANPGPENGLPAGNYSLESSFILGDGTILDSQTQTFTVTPVAQVTGPGGENLILQNMDPNSLVIANYNDQQQGSNFYVDAAPKAGVEVEVSGAAGSGAIIIGSYSSTPIVPVAFDAPVSQGGTGKSAIKYVDVRAPGFTQGTAHITVHYSADEISGFDPATLFPAYYSVSGNAWIKCDDITVDTTLNTVSGDVQVLQLTGTVFGIGADPLSSSSTVTTANNNAATTTTSANAPITSSYGTGIPWFLFAIVIGAFLVIGLIVLVVAGRRKKRS